MFVYSGSDFVTFIGHLYLTVTARQNILQFMTFQQHCLHSLLVRAYS
jgi:hypothetical protein